MPAAACGCLLPGAAAGGCCCCRAAAIKLLPKQETTAAAVAAAAAILEKNRFLVGCWLLAAGCCWRWLLATRYVHLLRALAHVLDTHWCHPRKTQFFVLLAAALLPLRLLLLRLLVSAAAY